MVRKKTHEQFIKEIKIKHPNIEVLGKYVDAKTPIEFKCEIHNNIWETTPDQILHSTYGCPICVQIGKAKKRTKSHQQFINEMKIKNKKVEVLEEYKGVKVKIKCRCLIHNEIFYATPNDLLQGQGCHKCKFEHLNGETNPRYNPNLTDEEREHNRKTKQYQDFIKNTLEYFNYTCQITNKRGGDLVVHHLNGYNWYVEGRMDVNNVIVIAKELHDKFHYIYGYGNNTKEQWEEFINNNNNNRDVI